MSGPPACFIVRLKADLVRSSLVSLTLSPFLNALLLFLFSAVTMPLVYRTLLDRGRIVPYD